MPDRHSLQVLLQPVLLAEFSGLAKRRGLERQNRLTVDFQHEDGRRWRVGLSEAPLPRLVEAPLAKLGRPSGRSALAFRTFLNPWRMHRSSYRSEPRQTPYARAARLAMFVESKSDLDQAADGIDVFVTILLVLEILIRMNLICVRQF
jgi:hypothetical protein